jgi:hypothetical protein
VITGSGATATNYAISYVDGTLTIDKAPLTITANNVSKYVGEPNPSFNATFVGLAGDDTVSSLNGTLTFYTPVTIDSVEGTYVIVPSGLSSNNYMITFINGTLSVTQRAPDSYNDVIAGTDQLQDAGGDRTAGTGGNAIEPLSGGSFTSPIESGVAIVGEGVSLPAQDLMTPEQFSTGASAGEVTSQSANTVTVKTAGGSSTIFAPADSGGMLSIHLGSGAPVNEVSTQSPLTVVAVTENQLKIGVSYQVNVTNETLNLIPVNQTKAAVPDPPAPESTQGTYVEIAQTGEEAGRYYVGIANNTLIIRPENDAARTYVTETDSDGNTNILVAGLMAAVKDLRSDLGDIQVVYVYKK